jgi:hypothetical protein
VPSHKAKASPPTADDVPVTRKMLLGVRTEILQRIDQGREETRAGHQKIAGALEGIRVDFKEDMRGIHAALREMRAEICDVKAVMERLEVLLEEQNAQNGVILDGIATLVGRQNQLEDTVRKLVAASPLGEQPVDRRNVN